MTSNRQRRYAVDSINALRCKIEDAVSFDLHATHTGPDFEYLVDAIHKAASAKLDRQVLRSSIKELAGVELTPELVKAAAWRIAGNMFRLRAGRVVPPWAKQPYDEWVPAQIVSMRRQKKRSGKKGHLLTFFIMAGLSAGLKTEEFWSAGQSRMFSMRMGFTRRAPYGCQDPYRLARAHPMLNPLEMVNLRVMGLISRELSLTGPKMSKIRDVQPPSILKWNKNLLKQRNIFTRQCPQQRLHQCFVCPVGYETCMLSTHRKDYTLQVCPKCEKESFFDPEHPTRISCVDCFNAFIYSNQNT